MKFTLLDLILIVVILSLLAAMIVPAVNQAILNARITDCGSNMSQLVKATYNYSITKCEPEGSWPQGVYGGRLWRVMHENGELPDLSVAMCPLESKGRLFRGPRPDGKVFCCCRPDNHGGGDNAVPWIAKSGDVHKTPAISPKWAWIFEQTED